MEQHPSTGLLSAVRRPEPDIGLHIRCQAPAQGIACIPIGDGANWDAKGPALLAIRLALVAIIVTGCSCSSQAPPPESNAAELAAAEFLAEAAAARTAEVKEPLWVRVAKWEQRPGKFEFETPTPGASVGRRAATSKDIYRCATPPVLPPVNYWPRSTSSARSANWPVPVAFALTRPFHRVAWLRVKC